MSLASLMSETVLWQKYAPGAQDAHGVAVPQWIENGEVPAYVEQTASQEILGERDTVAADWLVIIPAGVRIGAQDRLVYRGRTLEVVGDPANFHKPGMDHHIEIQARGVQG